VRPVGEVASGAVPKAAIAYWALVFALGFLLGSIRVLVLEPALGMLPATLIELPIMLGASWMVARWLLGRFGIAEPKHALAMGAIAFALLMGSEVLLTLIVFGDSVGEWIAGIGTPAGAIGLAGQVAFGLFPWAIRRREQA